ncbi:MAG TPA: AAA family ATPase, partial [Clostridia bacterium]|nr:AAA family ATPase [Clostridia bacterium]
DNVSLNGQISLVANELGIPNVFFAHVIYEILDSDNNDKYVEDVEDDVEVEDAIESKELPTRSPRIHPLNAILYGAPGTGKTYATAEYAVAIIENRDIKDEDREELMKKYRELQKEGKITFTTFHQSYGYEDFIQGLRPETKDGVMEFKPVDGVFKRIADKALNDNNSNYVIIIDEINRANMSKVLGELITLIEEDKRWGEINELSVTLPSGEVFVVPNNLYIIGTMNTADKSISIIDVALRRRFEFIEQQVDPSKVTDTKLREVLNKINSKLKDETDSTDLLVGHAYFMNKTIDDLDKLLNRAIIPLLYEYFFDNGKKVKSVIEEAIKDTGYKVDSSALGRIKVVKE